MHKFTVNTTFKHNEYWAYKKFWAQGFSNILYFNWHSSCFEKDTEFKLSGLKIIFLKNINMARLKNYYLSWIFLKISFFWINWEL